ncbi:hypothetical protein BB561_003526 [Smittium simulii]|uniref:F-box domain-containing protein n=1 Tax=Smittium simulii TaxID=133385 RepID=A0A2T9YKW3_9FUNG|nr:hypothetical protein BB561_003526 [Smittium simulii]
MNDSIEEEKLKDLIFAGKRCIRAEKCNDSIEIFTDLLSIKSNSSKAKVYAYRAQAFLELKLYGKALNDAQNAVLLDPRNPHIHWLASKIMRGTPNKPSDISEMQSGELNYDETSPNYNSLKELLDLYTNEKLTKNKKFDILLDIPINITFLILSRFSIPERLSLNRVCKAWKNFISSSQILWKDVIFFQEYTLTDVFLMLYENFSSLIPRAFYIKNTLNLNVIVKDSSLTSYNMSFSENNTSNCFKVNCYNFYFAVKNTAKFKYFTQTPISEKSVVRAINNASIQLESIIIPDSRDLGTEFISALTKKIYPRLSTFCVSRLTKITETSKILPLIDTFLQTNHLTKLCFSYNYVITSRIVYNIGLKCTNLKILDLSCTPKANWEKVLTRIAKHTNKEFFKNLEELYVENQLKNCILISNRMSQLGITFKKIKTLSLAWNINKRSNMRLSLDIFDISDEVNNRTFDLSFSAFPNLAHVCLDGLFEIYKPVSSFGHTSTDFVPSNTYIPNFCFFSCASTHNIFYNLSNNFFISMLKNSKKLKCLNVENPCYLQDSYIESILPFSSFLTVLNLTGCSSFSASVINLLIQQCGQHLEILELASTDADDSTLLTIAKFMSKSIRRINLDKTLSTVYGLFAISKAIKNMCILCIICNKRLSDFENKCNCFESIEAHQIYKMKKLRKLNIISRTPKRKFSELENPKSQYAQIINFKIKYLIDKCKRSNITISVLGCKRIWLEDIMSCKSGFCETFTKLIYGLNERERHFNQYSGVGGKLLQVIKGLYHAPGLAVKINNEVSDAVDYKHVRITFSPQYFKPLEKKYKYPADCFNRKSNRNNNFVKIKTCFTTILLLLSSSLFTRIQINTWNITQTLAKCGKSAAIFRLRQELSLTDLNIKTAVARTRAFGKWANLRAWISDLIKCPYKNQCNTWVSGCARWIKKYNGNIKKINNTIETLNNRVRKNDKLQISKCIAATEAGISCNWMGLELVYPELKTHINYVFKIRNGTYWTARRYAKSGFIEKRFIEECPFCRNIAPETIEHILLECSRWQALRADILAQYINIYRAQVATKPPLLPASISMRLVGKLLGEELKLSSTRIRKDPTVLCVKTTLATAKFFNAIALPRYLMLNSIRLAPIPPNQ